MAITAIASATPQTANSTSLTITKPTGTVDGHVMTAVLSWRTDPGTITVPTGWTLIRATGPEGAGALRLNSYVRAASSEGADYTWSWTTTAKVAGGITTWDGVDTTTPVDVSAGLVDDGINTNHDAPDATTTVADTRDLRAWAVERNDAITEPATHPERWEATTGGGGAGSNMTLSFGDRAFVGPGSLGVATATTTNAVRDAGQTVALKPAAAGGPTAVGKNLDLRWALRAAVGKLSDLRWAVRANIGKDLDLRWQVQSNVVFTPADYEEFQAGLNRLAGTTGLDAQGAANVWAGTTGLDLVGALNAKAATTGLELQGVMNVLAGLTVQDGVGINECVRIIEA